MEDKSKESETTYPKEKVLPLILSQLTSYGYGNLATVLATHTNTPMRSDKSDELSKLLYLGEEKRKYEAKKGDGKRARAESDFEEKDERDGVDEFESGEEEGEELSDVEEELFGKSTRQGESAPDIFDRDEKDFSEPPKMKLKFQSTHKSSATTAVFSRNGEYFATGSSDSTLKVISVNNIRTQNEKRKPVIRTLYDHREAINKVAFHPNGLVLASCSEDCSVKFFDLTLAMGKRSFRFINDSSPITSIDFHPTGEFLLASNGNREIKIYDVKTLNCFVPRQKSDARSTRSIRSLKYSNDGRLFFSSAGSTVSVWDGVNGNIIEEIDLNDTVNKLEMSKSNRYLLASCNKSTKLVDISSKKTVMEYNFGSKPKQTFSAFSHNENFVFTASANSDTIMCFNSKTGNMMTKYTGSSYGFLDIAASPTENSFVTCCQDSFIHYWSA